MGNPLRRVIGTDTAVDADRHLNGTDYDVLECGHRVRPDPGRSPAGTAERRACVNCGAIRQTKARGPVVVAVTIEDASPGGANLKVRGTQGTVWWLTRHNADFKSGSPRVGASGKLTLTMETPGWMPHYILEVE